MPQSTIGKTSSHFNWTVVGAGSAGVASVGFLLEFGIPENEILWIDPEFNVGRMGKYYYNVPGNALTRNYTIFIKSCRVFNEFPSASRDALMKYSDSTEECMLGFIVDPLRDITQHLRTKINSIQTTVTSLEQVDDQTWKLQLPDHEITSDYVILATGSDPKNLDYSCKTSIPLDLALDKQTLSTLVNPQEDTIAVIGGSHSAVLILKYLNELGIKRIINFYRNPLKYAYDMGDGIPPQFNGLKGETGRWAYSILERNTPISIIRKKNTQEARDAWLSLCNKIIYAVGYERSELPFANEQYAQKHITALQEKLHPDYSVSELHFLKNRLLMIRKTIDRAY